MTPSAARISLACYQCRSKKRRCDGRRPKCQLCMRLITDCIYSQVDGRSQARGGRVKSAPNQVPDARSPKAIKSTTYSHNGESIDRDSPELQAVIGATSGIMSAAMVTAQIQGTKSASQHPQIAPWNLGLGHKSNNFGSKVDECDAESIRALITWQEFSWLATVFFTDVHPVFGTFAEKDFWDSAGAVWQQNSEDTKCHDSRLSLVAALGALFSHDSASENRLIRHANMHLDAHLTQDHVHSHDLDSLILRTLYLRLTMGPNASWLSSCTMISVLEASITGKMPHVAPPHRKLGHPNKEEMTPASDEHQQKQVLTARLLNAWICNESGRPRPFDTLHESSQNRIPPWAPDTPSWDLLRLYDMSEILNPGISPKQYGDFKELLLNVCSFRTDHDVVVLSRTNLAIVAFRRLRSMSSQMSPDVVNQLIRTAISGLDAVERLAQHKKPWHHVSNVPFQVLCTLLLIDTRESLSLIRRALTTIGMIADVYSTQATHATLQIAVQLVTLAQKRKEEDSVDLMSAAREHTNKTGSTMINNDFNNITEASEAYTADQSAPPIGLMNELTNWDDIDWDQLLSNEVYLWT